MAINLNDLQGKKLSVLGNKAEINKDARVLVVGLGGTGTDALIRTKDAMYRRFDLSEFGGKIPGNIAFLGIDTDRSVLDKFVGEAYIDPAREFVHLEDHDINIKFTKKDKLLPNYIRDWINPGLAAPDTLGTGAAGVRQIGRYLLINGYADVLSKLTNGIRDILKQPCASHTMQVVVFSGISGGTGSGTFIDMGYLIQKVLDNLKIAPTTTLTAYLFLPDVNLANPNLPKTAHSYIKCNGYAALKDLDYLMGMKEKAMINPDHELVRFHQVYGRGSEDVVDTTEAPFNSVYLISDVNSPMHPIANGYEYALNIVSESVVNFVSLSTVAGSDGASHMALAAVDVNGATMSAGVKAVTPNGAPIMGNYCYKAIGAATAELPVEDVANYIAKKFFDKMNGLLERFPTSAEMSEFLKATKVDVSNAMGAIRNVLKGSPSVEHLQPKRFKAEPQQRVMLEKLLEQYRNSAHTAIDSNVPAIMKELKATIRQQIDIIFQDAKKGPFYANRLLTGYKNVPGFSDLPGLIDRVRGILNELSRRREASKKEKEVHSLEARNAYKRGMEAKWYTRDHFKDYIDEMVASCMKEVEEYAYDKLHGGYSTAILEFAMRLNVNIFDIYVKVLDTLRANFNAANVKVEGVKVKNMAGREYRWKLVEVNAIQSDLDAMFDSANIDNILTKFLTDMIKESQIWLNSGEQIMHKVEDFICDQFGMILGKSMDDILGSDFLKNQMNGEIAKLAMNAEVHFPADSLVSFPSGGHDIWNSVSVPYNSPEIIGKIEAYIKSKALTITPTHSNLTDRILWLKVNIGIPVFLYLYLKDYENAYENDSGFSKGVHLYEVKGNDWRNLPSLVPEALWSSSSGINAHSNKRAKAVYDHAREVFERGVKMRVIQSDDTNYYCCFTHKGEITGMIDRICREYQVTRENIDCAQTEGAKLLDCAGRLRELKEKILAADETKIAEYGGYIYNFYGNKGGESREFIEHSARCGFVMMPELVRRVERELAARGELDQVIGELDQAVEELEKDREKYEYFINGLITGRIRVSGAYAFVEGVEDALCALTGEKFLEYKMYTEFDNLNEAAQKSCREQIQESIGKMNESAQGMRELADKYEANTQKINKSIMRIQASTPREVKTFYSRMNMFLQMMKSDIEAILELQD